MSSTWKERCHFCIIENKKWNIKCLKCKSEPLWRLLSCSPEMAKERGFYQRELTAGLNNGRSTKDTSHKNNKEQHNLDRMTCDCPFVQCFTVCWSKQQGSQLVGMDICNCVPYTARVCHIPVNYRCDKLPVQRTWQQWAARNNTWRKAGCIVCCSMRLQPQLWGC